MTYDVTTQNVIYSLVEIFPKAAEAHILLSRTEKPLRNVMAKTVLLLLKCTAENLNVTGIGITDDRPWISDHVNTQS